MNDYTDKHQKYLTTPLSGWYLERAISIYNLRQQGWLLKQISARYHLHKSSVYVIIKRLKNNHADLIQ